MGVVVAAWARRAASSAGRLRNGEWDVSMGQGSDSQAGRHQLAEPGRLRVILEAVDAAAGKVGGPEVGDRCRCGGGLAGAFGAQLGEGPFDCGVVAVVEEQLAGALDGGDGHRAVVGDLQVGEHAGDVEVADRAVVSHRHRLGPRVALPGQSSGEVHQVADAVGRGVGGHRDVEASARVADQDVAGLEDRQDGLPAAGDGRRLDLVAARAVARQVDSRGVMAEPAQLVDGAGPAPGPVEPAVDEYEAQLLSPRCVERFAIALRYRSGPSISHVCTSWSCRGHG
jgi:hypothetical protein